uniref:Penicillin-binding protein n=1 Tax=Muribaculaceae bacterium Z82 TaxID=2304548 RepID=A0A7C9KA35_9BACT
MASRSIKNRPSIKKKHPFVAVLYVLTILFAVTVAGAVGVYALAASWIEGLDEIDVTRVEDMNTARPSEMYAADGTTLLARFQLESREPVGLSQISDYVKEGTVATEDERFYEHNGYDLKGIMRAAYVTLTGAGREGASTITQQFVRNTLLADEMNDISLKRKMREIYLAVKMEETYSKDSILLMYLNTINYGNGTYGIQAASQLYFSKNASDLTLAEAAALVGIPQSPTYNNPFYSMDNCIERRNLVLNRMCSNGYISVEERNAAQAEELVLNPSLPSTTGIMKYPYFTSYVRDLVSNNYQQIDLFTGGLRIITTLDVDTQEAAENAIRTKEESISPAIAGALVAIDPANGYVRALVGGKDFESSQTNLATGAGGGGGRPCGSSFKTFTLVAALEEGISPETIVDCTSPADIPETEYKDDKALKNIDNINYGYRSIKRAFAVSSNTGFVRLQEAIGRAKVLATAEKMGITSDLGAYASLTLGEQNVTMLEMADAYATLANGGIHYDAQPVYQIYDYQGNLVVDNSNPEGTRVLTQEVAHAAVEVMKTVVSTAEGTGRNASLPNGQPVAGKTGTSTDYYDITFCGITPQMSVAIWFGDPFNQEALPAHLGADDVFRTFMSAVLEGQAAQEFPTAKDPEYKKDYNNATYHVGTVTPQTQQPTATVPVTNDPAADPDDDPDDPDKNGEGNEGGENSNPSTNAPGNSGNGDNNGENPNQPGNSGDPGDTPPPSGGDDPGTSPDPGPTTPEPEPPASNGGDGSSED